MLCICKLRVTSMLKSPLHSFACTMYKVISDSMGSEAFLITRGHDVG